MTIEERLASLERKTFRWRVVCVFQLLVLLGIGGTLLAKPTATVRADDGILRGRGIILSDENGRARVLIGAPFPESNDRVRQDSRTASMIFLDEQGHDRLVVGEELQAQINGKVPTDRHRIGSGYGMTLQDLQGNERGGMGFLSNGRAVISLDRPTGDAWGAFVDDKTGFAGTLSIYDRSVGDGATGIFSGTQGKRAFMMFKGLDDLPRAELAVGADQKATFTISNDQGKAGQNVLPELLQQKP